jgi:hypothetical protein
MEAQRLEQLKTILAKNYGLNCSDQEALKIGTSLLSYFDTLLKNKWKLKQNEQREKF